MRQAGGGAPPAASGDRHTDRGTNAGKERRQRQAHTYRKRARGDSGVAVVYMWERSRGGGCGVYILHLYPPTLNCSGLKLACPC